MGKRRKAREIALQTLYELEAEGKEVGAVLEAHADRRGSSSESREYADSLVRWVRAETEILDSLIAAKLENWDLERLSLLMRLCLRLGLAESRNAPEVPSRVIIDEAIELARKYDSEEGAAFVNGLLEPLIFADRGERPS
jgi:N utilization substance protein B